MKTEDRQLDQLTAKWLQQTSKAVPGETFTGKVMESVISGGIVYQPESKRSKAWWWLLLLLLPVPLLVWYVPALLSLKKLLLTQGYVVWHWMEEFAGQFLSLTDGLKGVYSAPLVLLCTLAALLLLSLDWFFSYRKIHS